MEADMERLDLDIEALIPHRGPMRLIEGVLAVGAEHAVTLAVAAADWPLAGDGVVDPLVAIELVAQTAALLEGWKRLHEGGGGTSGWLVGIKRADFSGGPLPVGAELTTEVVRRCALEGYALFDGTVRTGDRVVASLSIQALRSEEGS